LRKSRKDTAFNIVPSWIVSHKFCAVVDYNEIQQARQH